jgi:hypothetical protein
MLKLFVTIIIIASIIVGALVLFLPRDKLITIIVFKDFFDVALPVLAFGALIKYLCTPAK